MKEGKRKGERMTERGEISQTSTIVFKLFLLFIVCAIRRTGLSGFLSSGYPTHRLIKDINIACKPHYTPLCTTHLNGSCGHETNYFVVSLAYVNGNTFAHHLNNTAYLKVLTSCSLMQIQCAKLIGLTCPQFQFSSTVADEVLDKFISTKYAEKKSGTSFSRRTFKFL